MKKLLIGMLSIFILMFGLYVWLDGVYAIPGDVRIIQSQKTTYGKAILFEDKDNHTFGVARLEKYMGFLYHFGGSSYGNNVKNNMPFEATGYATNDRIDSFAIGVKVAKNSNIKFIAIGNYMEDVSLGESYELSLKEVQENLDMYHLKEVVDYYVLFVVDEYTEDTWTIRGFDENGTLIAEQRFADQPRYIPDI